MDRESKGNLYLSIGKMIGIGIRAEYVCVCYVHIWCSRDQSIQLLVLETLFYPEKKKGLSIVPSSFSYLTAVEH